MRTTPTLAALAVALVGMQAFSQDAALPVERTAPSEQVQRNWYRENSLALIVGNSAYDGATFRRLNSPAADAAAMRETLGPHVTVDDNSRDNLTADDMKAALDRFARNVAARRPRLALVYFSGHGVTVAGNGVLVPVPSRPDRPEPLTQSVLARTWTVERLLRVFADVQVPIGLIILDACRSPIGGTDGSALLVSSIQIADKDAGEKVAPSEVRNGLPVVTVPGETGMFVAYATDAGATAADGPPGGTSLYTRHLLTHITTPVPVQQVLSMVSSDVFTATRQKPWTSQFGAATSVYINPPKDWASRQEAFWHAVLANPEGLLEMFLRHPDTRYGPHRTEAEALKKRMEAEGRPVSSPDAPPMITATVVVAGQDRLLVRHEQTGRVAASLPRGARFEVEAGGIDRRLSRVLMGGNAIGVARLADLQRMNAPSVTRIDLVFANGRAELTEASSPDYVAFAKALRGKQVQSIDLTLPLAVDRLLGALRVDALRTSLIAIEPSLHDRIRVRNSNDAVGPDAARITAVLDS